MSETPEQRIASLERALAVLIDGYRWTYKGYGNVACAGCGATGSEDDGKVRRLSPCSKACVWAAAEALLEAR